MYIIKWAFVRQSGWVHKMFATNCSHLSLAFFLFREVQRVLAEEIWKSSLSSAWNSVLRPYWAPLPPMKLCTESTVHGTTLTQRKNRRGSPAPTNAQNQQERLIGPFNWADPKKRLTFEKNDISELGPWEVWRLLWIWISSHYPITSVNSIQFSLYLTLL